MAFELFRSKSESTNIEKTGLSKRLPPGQYLAKGWPVLHAGPVPRFDPKKWDFKVFGLVKNPIILTYDEFMKLPKTIVMADMHCVTHWSTLDNHWEGILFKEIASLVQPKPEAKFVMVYCEYGYTTNLPLSLLMGEDVLFAYRNNGMDLTPEHGWPLRLVVPKRYAWKSAKWVRGLEFMAEDRSGYWEQYGYHNDADPWREQRYWGNP